MNIGWGQRRLILVVGRLLFGDLPRVVKDAAGAIRAVSNELQKSQGSVDESKDGVKGKDKE